MIESGVSFEVQCSACSVGVGAGQFVFAGLACSSTLELPAVAGLSRSAEAIP